MANDLLSKDNDEYDASSIEVLEGLEPVRQRPGMYIGGTDERALHHMVAEILDNSMDEAVAGHANRIEVELHDDYSVTVRDNGRGIPVDPHPKFPEKSALEVILCTLHSGGKFSGKAYQTSGGLHGVGSSVVNALSDSMVVQVAKNKELYEQRFSRGLPLGPVQKIGAAPNRRGTEVTFHADPEIFGSHRFKPKRLFTVARSKAYLFSGVEIRWKSAIDDGETPREAVFHFPGGLADYLKESIEGASTYSEAGFHGKVEFREKFNEPGFVEWAINWTPARDGFIQSYCNTVPTPEGGTHVAGFWAAILKGIKAYGELVGNKKAAQITRDDLLAGGCALVSTFIADPAFVGQTKDRLSSESAAKLVEGAVRDHFDNWLAADTKSAPRRKPSARPPPSGCACPASWWIARPARARAPNCSSSRATARAARPRWRATGAPRRSCRSGARSSTCSARPARSSGATPRSTICARRSAWAWARSSTSRICATTRSSS